MSLTLEIAGVATEFDARSLRISDAIQERSTMDVTVYTTGGVTYDENTLVEMFDENDEIVFGGVIDVATVTKIGTDGTLRNKLKCVDWHYFADKRLANFTNSGVVAGDNVKQIVNDYLAEEGVFASGCYEKSAWKAPWTDAIGFWRLGESSGTTATDVTGNYDGTYSGTHTLGVTGALVDDDDTAVEFGGGEVDFSGTMDGNDLTEEDTGSVTVAGWFKIDSGNYTAPGSTSFTHIFNNSWVNSGYLLHVQHETTGPSHLLFGVAKNSTQYSVGSVSDSAVSEDQWYFGVGVHDVEAQEIRLYLNGELVATNDAIPSSGAGTSTSTYAIGDSSTEGGWQLDEVAVYPAVLKDYEIKSLYDIGTTSRISDGQAIEKVTVSYTSTTEVLEELAEIAGFIWYIDPGRVMHFHERGTLTSAWNPGDQDVLWEGANFKKSNSKYRNKQVIRAGKDQTTQQTQTFTLQEDAVRSWTVAYPIAEEPLVEVDVGSGFSAATVSTKSDGSQEFLWSKEDATVAHSESATALSTGDKVRITYYGLYSIVVLSTDAAETVRLQDLEKVGTGTVEKVDDEPDVDDRSIAFQRAAGMLNRYAEEGHELSFKTIRSGLRAGQLATVTLDDFGLSGEEFLITNVETTTDDGNRLWYRVTASQGPVLRSWTQMFADFERKARLHVDNVSLGTDEIVTSLVPNNETWTWGTSNTNTAHSCPILPFTLDPGGVTLC